jgi:phosphoribosylanthranilate isomerase
MRVKICGITNIDDALLCSKLGADAVGFIFYDKSKRFIPFERAKDIIAQLPNFITKVGVFVNHPIEEINSICNETRINTVQLHGEELPEYVQRITKPVIKSFRIHDGFNFNILSQYKNCSFLLDSFSHSELGGSGLTFDWSKIPSELKNKIILAGGVSTDNIDFIYRKIKPQAVDLSSSVEISPGKKDKTKLKEFFNKVNKLRFSC